MNSSDFFSMLNEFVPNNKVSIVIIVVGLLSTFSCMIGIGVYNEPNLNSNGILVKKTYKYWLLWVYIILFIFVTLVGIYGVYHNTMINH